MNALYKKLINSKKINSREKSKLKNMSLKEINNQFIDRKLHFGTAGIRGIMGIGPQFMDKVNYQRMAYGYGKYLLSKFRNPMVVIGHDNRLNSDSFSLACADVLTSMGIIVYLFKNNNLMPTPIISYSIRKLKASGGIIVTASHNPKEYNGFKAYNPDGGQILPDVATKIEKNMPSYYKTLDMSFIRNNSCIKYISDSVISNYFSDIELHVLGKTKNKNANNFPIVVTTHHGTASNYLPKWLKSLGYKIKPLLSQCYPNSNFENSKCLNPEMFESFESAIKYAKKCNAKLIIGVDPDADRMAVMILHKNKWRLMTGNEMGIIYTHYLLNNVKFKKQPFIISSYVSTNYIDAIAKEYNAKVYRTGTGFKWMGAKVSELDNKQSFVVAFEEAIGGLNTNVNRDKDSFATSLLALKINDFCLKKKMDLLDYLQDIVFKKYGYWIGKTKSYLIKKVDWKKAATAKMSYFKKYLKIGSSICGLKVKKIVFNKIGGCLEWHFVGRNWIKFRMSGTEPKFKVYYELYGNSLDQLNARLNELDKLISYLVIK